jgi:hypothetical protein
MGVGQASKEDRPSNMPVYPEHTEWAETVSSMSDFILRTKSATVVVPLTIPIGIRIYRPR